MHSTRFFRCLFFSLFLSSMVSIPCVAHPLAPSLLEITETESGYDVLWKMPRKKEAGVNLAPLLPATCSKPIDPKTDATQSAYLINYKVECSESLKGQTVKIQGLQLATTNVVVRYIDVEGYKSHWLLSNENTELMIPLEKSASTIFSDYIVLGIEHLLGGIDHVLFVVALLLLVPMGRTLIIAITAFTLGHSITLALSALDLLAIPQQPIEILIAITIMLVASDVITSKSKGQTWLQRYPGMMTCLFGLIHGLGFAGVLGEIGLPPNDKIMALFAFNLGLEVGQLGVVFMWLAAAALISRFFASINRGVGTASPWLAFQRWQQLMAYTIGSVGAYWVFDRSFALLGGI